MAESTTDPSQATFDEVQVLRQEVAALTRIVKELRDSRDESGDLAFFHG